MFCDKVFSTETIFIQYYTIFNTLTQSDAKLLLLLYFIL